MYVGTRISYLFCFVFIFFLCSFVFWRRQNIIPFPGDEGGGGARVTVPGVYRWDRRQNDCVPSCLVRNKIKKKTESPRARQRGRGSFDGARDVWKRYKNKPRATDLTWLRFTRISVRARRFMRPIKSTVNFYSSRRVFFYSHGRVARQSFSIKAPPPRPRREFDRGPDFKAPPKNPSISVWYCVRYYLLSTAIRNAVVQ